MGQKNKYLDKFIPSLYRHTAMDIMIHTFIGAQRSLIPGISVKESALAFIRHYDIDEDDLSLSKVITTFNRLQKELIDERKTTH